MLLKTVIMISIIFIIILIRFYIFYKRYKKLSEKEKKQTILFGIFGIFLIICFFILLWLFPNKNCKIMFEIYNKAIEAEVRIINNSNNSIYYFLNENENIIFNDYNNERIAIKTKDKAKIVYFEDNLHIFTFPHKVKVIISDNDIKFSSWFVSIMLVTNNIKIYDYYLEKNDSK